MNGQALEKLGIRFPLSGAHVGHVHTRAGRCGIECGRHRSIGLAACGVDQARLPSANARPHFGAV